MSEFAVEGIGTYCFVSRVRFVEMDTKHSTMSDAMEVRPVR